MLKKRYTPSKQKPGAVETPPGERILFMSLPVETWQLRKYEKAR
jgi:hypothetical protein